VVGIWSTAFRRAPLEQVSAAAAELESLGFDTLWVPGSSGGDVFERSRILLQATSRVVVATGVVNIWMHPVTEVAERFDELSTESGDRFVLGLGCSHAALVERAGMRYQAPVRRMVDFLDELEHSAVVPRERLVLAALGPRMLAVARERGAGAHPFNVTAAHTSWARAALGDGPLLIPEVKVLFERDAREARSVARSVLAPHLRLPNYVANLRRLGFTDDDLSGTGSDRLVDALVAWGDESDVRQRIDEHVTAGATAVCLNVITSDLSELPTGSWRRLAAMLGQPSA